MCGIAACLPAMLIQPRGELDRDHRAMRFESNADLAIANRKGFALDFGVVWGGSEHVKGSVAGVLNLGWSDDVARNSTCSAI
jgi:hypothetical protein